MSSKPEIYFGGSDRQMESYLSEMEFKDALTYGVLLHGDLVNVDIFFYISRFISNMILEQKPASKFIIAAIKNNALIPNFRSANTESFAQNFQEILAAGIQGLQPRAKEIADILDKGIAQKRILSKVWPSSPVSVKYKSTIERMFLTNDIVERFPEIESTWINMAEIREMVFSNLKTDGVGGFRRGDIYNSVFAYFNDIKSETIRIDDVRDIWANIPSMRKTEDAKRIIKWVNYCYYYNQGKEFGLNPSFSAIVGDDHKFVKSLVGFDDPKNPFEYITEEFHIPSPSSLFTVDPNRLFEIRDSDIGGDYFSSILSWQRHQTIDTANNFRENLHRYVSALNSSYLQHGRAVSNWEWTIRVHIPTGPGRWGDLVRDVLLSEVRSAATNLIGKAATSSIVGRAAAVVFEKLPFRIRDTVVRQLGISNKVTLRVETQSKKTNNKSNIKGEASFSKI